MEETSDEHIHKEVVMTSSLKSTIHKSVLLFSTILIGFVLVFFALIGIIIFAIGLYFKSLDDDCMNACMNEGLYSHEVCQQKYCS